MTFYKPDQRLLTLVSALKKLNTTDEFVAFLRDLLTEPEIAEFSGRFAVAQSLAEGKSQRVASQETGVSIATVTRVNQWLLRGMGGYKTAIIRLNQPSIKATQFHHHRKAS